jgi:nucleoid-associated protein YgaU
MKQGTVHVIVFLCLVGGIFFTMSNLASDDTQYMEVTIEEGDSLWSISEEYNAKHHYSSWEFIQWVEERNSVNASAVFPGQKIVIPVVSK